MCTILQYLDECTYISRVSLDRWTTLGTTHKSKVDEWLMFCQGHLMCTILHYPRCVYLHQQSKS